MNLKKQSILIVIILLLTQSACENNNQKANGKQILVQEVPANNLVKSSYNGANESQKQNKNHRKAGNNTANGILVPAPMKNTSEQILKRKAYITSYNAQKRLPNWVAWRLTSSMTSGTVQRKNMRFEEDFDVQTPRATHLDYMRSGYDRGHMYPAGDAKYNFDVMKDCFLMTNICPQNSNLNSGDWNELEKKCRSWAQLYGEIHIVCGPIFYNQRHRTIGKNKVVVPEAFFKVVLCLDKKPKAIGFIYKNNRGNRPMGDYINSVDEVEKITGIDFFTDIPNDIEQYVEAQANLKDWL